jgi:hypothetical protein
MKPTKLADYLLQTSLMLSCIAKFEPKHRSFLETHENGYFVLDGRICFIDSVFLDVIGYFGGEGWKMNTGELVKEIDGVEVKLFHNSTTETLVTITPKEPFLPIRLDVIGGQTCKISLPSMPVGHNGNN